MMLAIFGKCVLTLGVLIFVSYTIEESEWASDQIKSATFVFKQVCAACLIASVIGAVWSV